jgi:hypothetical protein
LGSIGRLGGLGSRTLDRQARLISVLGLAGDITFGLGLDRKVILGRSISYFILAWNIRLRNTRLVLRDILSLLIVYNKIES